MEQAAYSTCQDRKWEWKWGEDVEVGKEKAVAPVRERDAIVRTYGPMKIQ